MSTVNLKELFLALVRSPNFGWRTFVLFISISLAVSVYTFIVDFYDPESNILSNILNLFPSKHEFFSGSPGGFYISLGTELSNELGKLGNSISLANRTTAGGYENAINVLVTPKSFGLVQEETIRSSDFIREHVNYVTPLYMERMHVLYRYDRNRIKNSLLNKNSKSDPGIKISSQLNENTKIFFRNARISTGPVGSSGRIITSYILNHINNVLSRHNPTDNKSETFAYSTKKGLEELTNDNGEVDAVFLVAGAPVDSVRNALSDENIFLMSIEPSVVAALNKDYGLNFRMSDFKNKYTDLLPANNGEAKNKGISTLGSYAFLIASKDVSSSDTMEVIEALHNIKGKIRSNISFPESSQEKFQLDEFEFYKSFRGKNTESLYQTIKKLLIFTVTVSGTTALVMSFFIWAISGVKQNYYFQRIHSTVGEHMPAPIGMDDHSGHFPTPIVKLNLSEEISNLVRGLEKLTELRINLNEDYQTGGITDSHFVFLAQNIDNAKNDLGSSFYRRLKVFFERGNLITEEDLVRYYSAGYIDNEQYSDLKTSLTSNS